MIFYKVLKNEFETAMVNESLVLVCKSIARDSHESTTRFSNSFRENPGVKLLRYFTFLGQLAVCVEILSNLQQFRMKTCWCVLIFCQLNKISSIHICIYVNKQLHHLSVIYLELIDSILTNPCNLNSLDFVSYSILFSILSHNLGRSSGHHR